MLITPSPSHSHHVEGEGSGATVLHPKNLGQFQRLNLGSSYGGERGREEERDKVIGVQKILSNYYFTVLSHHMHMYTYIYTRNSPQGLQFPNLGVSYYLIRHCQPRKSSAKRRAT